MRFKPFLKSAQCNTWISCSMLKIVKLIVHRELCNWCCKHVDTSFQWYGDVWNLLRYSILKHRCLKSLSWILPTYILRKSFLLPRKIHCTSTHTQHLVSYLHLPLIAATSVGLAQDNALKKFTSLKDCRLCCYDKSACLSIYIYIWLELLHLLWFETIREISQISLDCLTKKSKGRKWWEGLKPQRLLSERGDKPKAHEFHRFWTESESLVKTRQLKLSFILWLANTTSIELMW